MNRLTEEKKTKKDLIREIEYLRERNSDIRSRYYDLKRSQKFLRLALFSIENTMNMIFWTTPESRFFYVNEAVCKTLGYTREELLSMDIFDVDIKFKKEDWPDYWEKIKEQVSTKIETKFRAKNGSIIPVEATVNYFEFEGREYNCSIVTDITERKKAEEEIKESKNRAEMYLDLMGHDINNLNQIALGYLELADDILKTDNRLEKADKQLIEKPIEALNNSSKLISNVKKIQRIKAGTLQFFPTDLCDILSELRDRYARTPDRDVTINYISTPGCIILSNRLITDVFSNIIENSIKHSDPDKPLFINIEVSMVKENKKEYYKVVIEDNGPGIPDALKKKIFKRFVADRKKAEGRGLGLFVVKTLVEEFKGKIRVEDRVQGDRSKGSRFIVTLPVMDDSPVANEKNMR